LAGLLISKMGKTLHSCKAINIKIRDYKI